MESNPKSGLVYPKQPATLSSSNLHACENLINQTLFETANAHKNIDDLFN